jgi:Uncharacterized conserved protein
VGKGTSNNIDVLCDKLENLISTKTVVGDAITIGDVVILPLIEVSFGLGAGVSENTDKKNSESSGGGMGAKITPSAVIAIINGNVQLINIKNQDAINKLIDMAPGVVSKLDFGSIFGKKDKPKEEVKFEEKIIVE